jgi:hypothetical protein
MLPDRWNAQRRGSVNITKPLVWFGTGVLLFATAVGCGDNTAISGSSVTVSSDLTVEYPCPAGATSTAGGLDILGSPLEVHVFGPDGKTPLPGVKVQFYFGGGGANALTDRSGTVFLNPSDPLYFETITNEFGVPQGDVYPTWVVPGSNSTVDVTLKASVSVSIGVASKLWTVTATAKKCG